MPARSWRVLLVSARSLRDGTRRLGEDGIMRICGREENVATQTGDHRHLMRWPVGYVTVEYAAGRWSRHQRTCDGEDGMHYLKASKRRGSRAGGRHHSQPLFWQARPILRTRQEIDEAAARLTAVSP